MSLYLAASRVVASVRASSNLTILLAPKSPHTPEMVAMIMCHLNYFSLTRKTKLTRLYQAAWRSQHQLQSAMWQINQICQFHKFRSSALLIKP